MKRIWRLNTLVLLLGAFLWTPGLFGEEAPDPVDVLRKHFELPAGDSFQVEIGPRPQNRLDRFLRISSRSVRIPSVVKTRIERNNTIDGLFYEPLEPTDRAILFLPWFKDRNMDKVEWICQFLAASGYKVFFMPMGYQFGRAPKGYGSGSFIGKGGGTDHLQEWARQAVLDVRRSRKWLIESQGIHPEKLGLLGISLGGFIGALTYGVCPEWRSAAIVLAGGNLANLLQVGADLGVPQVTKELKRFGVDAKDLPALIRPFDPITYADPARKNGLFLANGIFDPLVPFPLGQDLWTAYGKPNRLILPSGHASSVVFTPLILTRVLRHMDRTLKP
ncbi:MAG: hypothetical protein QF752_07365 [Planctomycetota bacterium]|jgi:hypothetical protein|nr:hypothetical protein [Planctomycetota bacterium]